MPVNSRVVGKRKDSKNGVVRNKTYRMSKYYAENNNRNEVIDYIENKDTENDEN